MQLANRQSVAALLLALLCIGAFVPTARNEFVNWDDDHNFLTNEDFRGLGLEQVRWAWQTRLLGVYQPVGWMICSVEYACWGLNPRGYHWVSVLFHAANVVLLFLFAVRIVRIRWPELAGRHPGLLHSLIGLLTALYGVHPLRVEYVAWASCQTYVVAVTFYLLSLLAFLRYRTTEEASRNWLAVCWVCFVLGLLCKVIVFTLPIVMLFLDRYILRASPRGRWTVALERTVFALPAVIIMMLAIWARDSIVSIQSDGYYSRVGFASASVWFYWIKTLMPTDLVNLYHIPAKLTLADREYLLSIIGVVIVSAIVFVTRRRWPLAWPVWLLYLCLLAPSSGLVRSGPQVFADRYCYLPMMVFVVALSGILFSWVAGCPRRVWLALSPMAIFIPVLFMLCHDQCAVWQDSESLWRHNLAHGGQANPTAHHQLANWLQSVDRNQEALAHFQTAAELDRGNPESLYSLGLIMIKLRSFAGAEAYLDRAFSMDPDRTKFRCALAQALSFQGKTDRALKLLQELIDRGESTADVHYQIGFARMRTPQLADAVSSLETAVRLDGKRPEYRLDLGIALVEAGRSDRALTELTAAENLRPNDGETHVALGHCLARLGRLTDAIPHLRRAIRLVPANAYAHGNLGIALCLQGDSTEAKEELTEAIRIDPQHVNFRFQLGVLLARLQQRQAAIDQFNAVLMLAPNHVGAQRGLENLSKPYPQ